MRVCAAAIFFWVLVGLGVFFFAVYALCRCFRGPAPMGSSPLGSSPLGSSPLGSSPLGSSPSAAAVLEAQRRAHEARLAVWGAATDSSDEDLPVQTR